LGFSLATAGRDSYLASPGDGDMSALAAINEMLIVIFKQLSAAPLGSREGGYPNEAFLETLAHHAQQSKAQEAFTWAITRALAEVESLRPE
jgi:hypothetical protein